MNTFVKTALVPALTYAAGRALATVTPAAGAYAGFDLFAGQAFAGTQGRLDSTGAPAEVAPSAETGGGRRQYNLDAQYALGPRHAAWRPYAGAGLCVASTPDATTGSSSHSPGLNLLGGVNIDLGPVTGFAQARLTLADGVHLSLTVGALPAAE